MTDEQIEDLINEFNNEVQYRDQLWYKIGDQLDIQFCEQFSDASEVSSQLWDVLWGQFRSELERPLCEDLQNG